MILYSPLFLAGIVPYMYVRLSVFLLYFHSAFLPVYFILHCNNNKSTKYYVLLIIIIIIIIIINNNNNSRGFQFASGVLTPTCG